MSGKDYNSRLFSGNATGTTKALVTSCNDDSDGHVALSFGSGASMPFFTAMTAAQARELAGHLLSAANRYEENAGETP